MPIPFTSEVLTRVVDKRRPVRTPIRDRHFTGGMQYGTPNIGYDVLTGPEGIATAISHGVQSAKTQKAGWSHLSLEIPRFTEHDAIKAADLIGLRAPGQVTESEALMQRYNRSLDQIRGKFDRTLEYMCFGAFRGNILDGALNVIATYPVRAQVTVTFNSTSGGDDPFLTFRNIIRTISRTLGGDVGTVYGYCGDDAYDLLHQQHAVAAARANIGGNAEVGVSAEGITTRVGSVTVENILNVWANDAGVDQTFVEDDEIIFVPSALGGEVVKGPCETPAGLLLAEWFVDSWQERDPPANFVRVETNRMPIVTRPDAIYRLKVQGS